MARPRTSNRHLPKYVTIKHGAYYFTAPGANPVRVPRDEGYIATLSAEVADFARDVGNLVTGLRRDMGVAA